MPKGYKLTQKEAYERLLSRGYILVSDYHRKDRKVSLFCGSHNQTLDVRPGAIWRGGMLACCAKESRSKKLSIAMAGSGNNFFGRNHSLETRLKISASRTGPLNANYGKPRPDYLTQSLLARITGVPRSQETKDKISKTVTGLYRGFSYCVRNAESGKTAGRPGLFYIVRVGDELKFGSATTTMAYRLKRLRQKLGSSVSVVLYALVPDAGAYEAAMMEYYREHWIRGERFRDFLAS